VNDDARESDLSDFIYDWVANEKDKSMKNPTIILIYTQIIFTDKNFDPTIFTTECWKTYTDLSKQALNNICNSH
jgi:hypothetical protein